MPGLGSTLGQITMWDDIIVDSLRHAPMLWLGALGAYSALIGTLHLPEPLQIAERATQGEEA